MPKTNIETGFDLFKKASIFVRTHYISVILLACFTVLFGTIYLLFSYFDTQLVAFRHSIEAHDLQSEVPKNIAISSTSDNKHINDSLYELMTATKADRAYVFQFHNGKKSIGGVEFVFMTNTHEQVMPGVSSEISNLQNIPTSVATEMLEDLFASSGSRCWEVSKIKDTGNRQTLTQQAIKHLCFAYIHDEEGNPVGFTGIDYVNRPFNHLLEEKNLQQLEIYNAKIEAILAVKK